MAQVFSNKLEAAEENLKNALKQLEKLGLEMEVGEPKPNPNLALYGLIWPIVALYGLLWPNLA